MGTLSLAASLRRGKCFAYGVFPTPISALPPIAHEAYNDLYNHPRTMNLKEIAGEFKTFIMKGNVIDLAVGVLIGAAFGGVVKAFTDGIISPLISYFGGGKQITLHLWVFDVGLVLNAIIGFLITALILFFIFVKPMNKLKAMTEKKEAGAPPPPEDIQLLREIRDLLKSGAKPATPPSGGTGEVV